MLFYKWGRKWMVFPWLHLNWLGSQMHADVGDVVDLRKAYGYMRPKEPLPHLSSFDLYTATGLTYSQIILQRKKSMYIYIITYAHLQQTIETLHYPIQGSPRHPARRWAGRTARAPQSHRIAMWQSRSPSPEDLGDIPGIDWGM